jgi:hypothetical protein
MTTLVALTVLMGPLLIMLAMMLFVLTGLESGVRRLAVFALVGAAVACGMLLEQFLYVNRHMDMCFDDQAASYRAANGFDPYCEVLSRGR